MKSVQHLNFGFWWWYLGLINIYVLGFDISFKLNQVLHHGTQYSELFKKAYIELTDEIESDSESDDHYFQTLKSLPWNLNVSYSLNNRQVQFNSRINKRLPDVKHKNTILKLAQMSYDSYVRPDIKNDWIDLGKKYNLVEGFGWEQDGIRAFVFADSKKEFGIISFKGTSASLLSNNHQTDKKDKFNDNLLFSCCSSNIDTGLMSGGNCLVSDFTCKKDCVENNLLKNNMVNYYYAAKNIFKKVEEQFPLAQIWLTGHSLGGSLSSLIGLTFNVPAVTFESPGDLLPAKRLQLPNTNDPLRMEEIPIWHFGHNADPIFTGECKGSDSFCYLGGYAIESKCHTGKTCMYDTKGKKNWSPSILKHQLSEIIDEVISEWDNVPDCVTETGCVDCSNWVYQ